VYNSFHKNNFELNVKVSVLQVYCTQSIFALGKHIQANQNIMEGKYP